MLVVKHYDSYDIKQFKSPWIGRLEVDTGDLVYDAGGYTGDYKTGTSGDLYVNEPEAGTFYAYGQKENKKGGSSNTHYVYYDGENLIPVDSFIMRCAIDNQCDLKDAVEMAIDETEKKIIALKKKLDDYNALMNEL